MDPYLLLGVTSDTPLCQITQTYRQMARLVHPDSNQMKWSEEECEDAFIKIKLAFDHIQGLTEKMKGRVSAGRLPSPNSKCEEECIEWDEEENCIIFAQEVCYDISRINTGSSIAKRFQIDTRILWTDNFGIEKELEFKTIQLVMNKAF